MTVSERYAFGDFLLERSQQRVTHRDGTQLNLPPRHFSALLLFAERAGQLLDKDTLMLALWPGLVVEENNLSQVVSSLRRALGDDTQGSRYIQTVPRRGFRFVATVTVLPDADELPRTDAPPPDRPPEFLPEPIIPGKPGIPADPSKRHAWRLVLVTGAAAVATGAAWWVWRRTPAGAPVTQRPTLAVLPFKPLVAEGRDELLEVGMADSLITRLSTVPGLVVRSVGSVLRYAGPEAAMSCSKSAWPTA